MSAPVETTRDRRGTHLGRERPVRVLIFLQGTILMHSGAVGRSRKARVAQSRGGSDPSVRDIATYVPIGNAAAKIRGWEEQGARIAYLTSSRGDDKVAVDTAVLRRYGFPAGPVLARHPGEGYGDVAGRELPDVLIEDDCESIGEDEVTYSKIRPDLRARITSIIVAEFGGVDHLPDSLDLLLDAGR